LKALLQRSLIEKIGPFANTLHFTRPPMTGTYHDRDTFCCSGESSGRGLGFPFV